MTNSTNLPIHQSTNLPPPNPYVGPRTFSYEQRHLFFGREREARDLLARVLSERLLLFYAQSGAGKSSLINTRLIPSLQEEKGFVVLPVARVSGELPAGVAQVDNIFAFNLMLSIVEDCDPALLAGVTLSDFLARLARRPAGDGQDVAQKGWVYDAAATPAPAAPNSRRYALIVDQFEEIITSHPARWQEREAFFHQLDAAMQTDPNLWVVLSLREDYVAALDPYAPLVADRLRARFFMQRMGAAAALDAIGKPAELTGQPFAPGVAEKLVDDLRQVRVAGQAATVPGQYVEPVQLQVVCYQLWENLAARSPLSLGGRAPQPGGFARAGGEGEITLDDLAVAGDVNTALTQFYEETLAAALADPAAAGVSERQLRVWFDEKLITEAGTRGLVHQGESDTGGLPNGVVRALQRRFLVRSEARGGVWIELVHDRFVEPIRASNAAWFPVHLSALQRQAALWDEQGRSSGLLLRDAALVEAQAWAVANPSELEPTDRGFLETCLQAQKAVERERRQSRIITALAALALALMVVAVGFAVWASLQRRDAEQQARRATAAGLASSVQSLLTGKQDPSGSLPLLLAQRAVSTTLEADGFATLEAESALRQAIDQAPPWIMTLPHQRHSGQVNSVAFSPDGATILTASDDGTARLWNFATGQQVKQYVGNADEVLAAVYSPDGASVATTGKDAAVWLWDAATGENTRQLIGHKDWVLTATFSPDGRILATGSADTSARLWDVATGREIKAFEGHGDWITSVAFSPDGETLLTGSLDGKACLWSVASGQQQGCLEGGQRMVWRAIFRPDGRMVATAGDDGSIVLWDVASGQALRQLMGDAGPVRSIAFDHAGKLLASAGEDFVVRLWEVDQGQEVAQLTGHRSAVRSVAFSRDDRWLASGGGDTTVRVWDVANRVEASIFDQHGQMLRVAEFAPQDDIVITAGRDGHLWLWDLAANRPIHKLHGHSGNVYLARFDDEGQRVISMGEDGTIRIWNAVSGGELSRFGDEQAQFLSGAVDLERNRIATGETSGLVRLWDLETGTVLWQIPAHEGPVVDIGFQPGGQVLATTGADAVARLWNAQDGRLMEEFDNRMRPTSSLAFSPDGNYLAEGGDDGVALVRDLTTREIVRLVGHQDAIHAIAFSPDGERIATGSRDKSARIWERETGKELLGLEGHQGSVTSLAFDSRGDRLITASSDSTARVWDLRESHKMRFSGHSAAVRALKVSPDGTVILSGSDDGTACLWQVDTGRQILCVDDQQELVRSVAFHPTQPRFATAGNGAICVWQSGDGAKVGCWQAHQSGVVAIAYDPTGARLASGGEDGLVKIWDAASGDELRQWAVPVNNSMSEEGMPPPRVWSVAFSPDGNRLATTGDDDFVAHLWDVATGAEIGKFTHRDYVRSAAFSPDGRVLLTSGEDADIILWDIESREARLPLRPGAIADSASFNESGDLIVASLRDNSARIWRVVDGMETTRLVGHDDWVRTAAFGPDSRWVVTGSNDETLRLWYLDSNVLMETASHLIQRDPRLLTASELIRFGLSK